jgi:hypothetical protein
MKTKPMDPEKPIETRYWLNLAISDPKQSESESFTQFYDIDLNETEVCMHERLNISKMVYKDPPKVLKRDLADELKSKLIGCYKFKPAILESDDKFIIEVREDGINVYKFDNTEEPYVSIDNVKIRNCHLTDERFLYTLQQPDLHEEDQKEMSRTEEKIAPNKEYGVFIYDMLQVLQKSKMKLKIAEALVAVNTQLVHSAYNQRFSFLKDFRNLIFMPMVHRNTLKFIGMDSK